MNVSLIINNTNIKILLLKGRKVHRWHTEAIEEGLVQDGLILQPAKLGAIIAAGLKAINAPRDQVVISMGGMSYTYRFLALPVLKPSMVNEAIFRAIKKELSFPMEQLYLSWKRIAVEASEATYFVIGTPRNVIDALTETLRHARVERHFLDIKPLALARAAGRDDAIIVNLDRDNYDIVFVTGGMPIILHTLNPRAGGATLEDNIRRLSSEISKMAAFYESNHPGSAFKEKVTLLYTGELAAESAAAALLQAESEYEIEPMALPVDAPDDFPSPAYGVSAGLAMKRAPVKSGATGAATGFHDISINLFTGLKNRLEAKPVQTSKTRTWWIFAIFVLLLILYWIYSAGASLKKENDVLWEQLRILNREITLAEIDQDATAGKEATLQQLLGEAQALQDKQEQVAELKNLTPSLLDTVAGAMPKGVDYSSLEVDATQVTVRGYAETAFLVVDYAEALEGLGVFSGVDIQQILPGEEEAVLFFIELYR